MRSNCFIYAIGNFLRYGGKLRIYKSRTWWGWHMTWIDFNDIEWEYTIEDQSRKSWWYTPLLFNGIVKHRPYKRSSK